MAFTAARSDSNPGGLAKTAHTNLQYYADRGEQELPLHGLPFCLVVSILGCAPSAQHHESLWVPI